MLLWACHGKLLLEAHRTRNVTHTMFSILSSCRRHDPNATCSALARLWHAMPDRQTLRVCSEIARRSLKRFCRSSFSLFASYWFYVFSLMLSIRAKCGDSFYNLFYSFWSYPNPFLSYLFEQSARNIFIYPHEVRRKVSSYIILSNPLHEELFYLL